MPHKIAIHESVLDLENILSKEENKGLRSSPHQRSWIEDTFDLPPHRTDAPPIMKETPTSEQIGSSMIEQFRFDRQVYVKHRHNSQR